MSPKNKEHTSCTSYTAQHIRAIDKKSRDGATDRAHRFNYVLGEGRLEHADLIVILTLEGVRRFGDLAPARGACSKLRLGAVVVI